MVESTPDLQSSPAARAFFAALDGKGEGNNSNKKQSDFVRKRIQTLGWRNRYSQDELYPIDIRTVGAASHFFSVVQVQRGALEGTYGTGAHFSGSMQAQLGKLEKVPTGQDLPYGRRLPS
jgi:hypothetical protein